MGHGYSRPIPNVESGSGDLNVIGGGRFSFQRARGEAENRLKDLGGYLPLYKATVRGEWNEARRFIDEDPEAVTAKISIASETALHLAVGAGGKGVGREKSVQFIEKLMKRMCPEDLALTDQNGETAFSVAAVVGNIEAAESLVHKNPDLPNIRGKSGWPIHRAAQYAQHKMISFLLEVTKDDNDPHPFAGQFGAQLLIDVITADFFDIALKLVNKYPEIATVEVHGVGSPLGVLAKKTTAFPSGWSHQWPYSTLVRQREQMQRDAILLVRNLCMEILALDDAEAFTLLQQPLLTAATLGIHEIIEEIVEVFPPAIWASDDVDQRNVFQLAVLNRRENVFNLIYQMSDYKLLVTRYIDSRGNNILHLAGELPTPDRLQIVSGPALQVQRELQWFKEVEKFVQPAHKEATNKDEKTPHMVFREAHQGLIKEGEKWMKKTASACTVVAALIATVAFSAAIRVPGGTDRKDGHPLFSGKTAFSVFAVADAISLITTVTAILMFLSILTSRYSEEDFLVALPTKLMFGFCMLFISILTLMLAFTSAIYLLFPLAQAIAVIIMAALAVLPVTIIVLFPPLRRLFITTYCGGFFGKKSDHKLH